jgi:hypothetical protein
MRSFHLVFLPASHVDETGSEVIPPCFLPAGHVDGGTGSEVIPPCFLPARHVDGTGNEVIPPCFLGGWPRGLNRK